MVIPYRGFLWHRCVGYTDGVAMECTCSYSGAKPIHLYGQMDDMSELMTEFTQTHTHTHPQPYPYLNGLRMNVFYQSSSGFTFFYLHSRRPRSFTLKGGTMHAEFFTSQSPDYISSLDFNKKFYIIFWIRILTAWMAWHIFIDNF